MFKETITKIIKEYLSINATSPLLYAKISTKVSVGDNYEYSVIILNQDKQKDEKYPTIPGIESASSYDIGNIVIVAIMYNDLSKLEILRRCL